MKLISIEEYRKLFNEEFRKTQKLIEQGETHLNNLAEGFTEADRVLRSMPSVDVAAGSLSRLQELAEADGKGCTVMLPCNLPQTMIDSTYPEHPVLMKRVALVVSYEHKGCRYYMGYDTFADLVKCGRIKPVGKEAEETY